MPSQAVTLEVPPARDFPAEIKALPAHVVEQAVKRSRFYRLSDKTFSWNLAFDNEFSKFPLTV